MSVVGGCGETSERQDKGQEGTMKYELEFCRRVGDEDNHTSYEKTISTGNDIDVLKELAKTIKLKSNKYRREELRIIEVDEFGDIVNYVWWRE